MSIRNRLILAYLLLFMFTVAHMFEEAWGGFWISHALGLGWFLLVNWLLLCMLAIFYLPLVGLGYFGWSRRRVAVELHDQPVRRPYRV